jgi:hypothetical protein
MPQMRMGDREEKNFKKKTFFLAFPLPRPPVSATKILTFS